MSRNIIMNVVLLVRFINTVMNRNSDSCNKSIYTSRRADDSSSSCSHGVSDGVGCYGGSLTVLVVL